MASPLSELALCCPVVGFDSDRCAKAVEALKLYRSDYDERHSVLRPRPVHDWTSNCADALRYLAVTGELIGDGVARVKNFNRPLDMPIRAAIV
jgi:hypothetical protein